MQEFRCWLPHSYRTEAHHCRIYSIKAYFSKYCRWATASKVRFLLRLILDILTNYFNHGKTLIFSVLFYYEIKLMNHSRIIPLILIQNDNDTCSFHDNIIVTACMKHDNFCTGCMYRFVLNNASSFLHSWASEKIFFTL